MTATPPAGTDATIPMRPFAESLPMALLLARESAMRAFRPLLSANELTEQQWRVLRALAASDRPLDASALAEHTALLAPSLSRILANLEGRGLIDRSTSADDQRRAVLSLAEPGIALVRRVAPASEAAYRRIEQEFGGGRLQALLHELRALAELDLAGAGSDVHAPAHDHDEEPS